jgi:hypothetical protein
MTCVEIFLEIWFFILFHLTIHIPPRNMANLEALREILLTSTPLTVDIIDTIIIPYVSPPIRKLSTRKRKRPAYYHETRANSTHLRVAVLLESMDIL